jgi:hypothetical protein
MTELIFRNWNNRKIRQRADGYLSATDMCASCGKQFSEWKRLKATIDDLQALESVMGISQDGLINIIQGGIPQEQGTWVHRRVAINLAQWLSPIFGAIVNGWVEEILLKGKIDLTQQSTQPAIIVTTEDIRVQASTIKYFTDCGDLQLAQLLKNKLGNALLAEQQMLPGTTVPQLEGAVDVAIRLGFQVLRNFECTLGKYVKSRCAHLIQGTGQRYSNASAKQIPATMYPANNPEVEGAVLDYCVSKAFRSHRVELN